ncbi:MAG: FAD-linked oxidase C-terminal domain-containing protein [Buchananella hordeovulneris]|nr:FAD-linked oxidase C-terminal domain-containing protein [Buchananella hordeovulneris]
MTSTLSPNALADFVKALSVALEGEVDAGARRRAEYATDASNYRIPPAVVACPRSVEDVITAAQIAREHGVPLTSRGAGTSCAGNSIGPGLVLDFSRHMNKVLELDPTEGWALVEPGTVMATLQQEAAPHGLRFGPDPSTWTRAALGGMIGNNACGPHAVAFGRTADNVLELDALTGSGKRILASAGKESLAQIPGLEELVAANLAAIRTGFGKFGRQVSGYSMEHLLPENGRHLARFLTGTEGTLATTLSARLRLVPLAAAPVLVVLGYRDMIEAGYAVPAILAHKPLAVEGMDSRLVEVVRRHKGPGAVPALPEGEGWLMVEVDAAAPTSELTGVAAAGGEDLLAAALARAEAIVADAGALAARIYPPGSEAAALWRIRADGAGLGGRTPAGDPAWPGWEDAAVPPQRLGDYLRDFTALMQRCKIDGLLYGHFGDGCLHVRLDFPLREEGGKRVMRDFLTEAAGLVASYGGSLSGEHGDGRARSELLPLMYNETELGLFKGVKHLFDPAGHLNPGVLVDPDPLDVNLRLPGARPVPALTGKKAGFAFEHDHGDVTAAMHRCTGVGKCRADNSGAGGFMCPSYQATKDEKDVTRGRARVLQELSNGNLVAGFGSPELMSALDLCLSCKACSADCPTGMDLARLKSESLHRAYLGKLRPRPHYLLGRLPQWLKLAGTIPGGARLGNVALGIGPLRRSFFRLAGIDPRRQMAQLATKTFPRWARQQGATTTASVSATLGLGGGRPADGAAAGAGPAATSSKVTTGPVAHGPIAFNEHFGQMVEQTRHRFVVLWSDSFSNYLQTAGARAMYRLLKEAGYEVLVPDQDVCCGLTWISTGQLPAARRRMRELVKVLSPFAAHGIPIIGVEPSCTAVLRDDLLDLLPGDAGARAVSRATLTLAELLSAPAPLGPPTWQPPSLEGVEVVAQPHCHHYSVMGWRTDAALLARTGAKIKQLSGCCGLAGNFGMEQGHYEVSVAVANNALLPALAQAPDAVYLADGFSCRTQAEQLAGRRGIHLAQLLLGEHAPLD